MKTKINKNQSGIAHPLLLIIPVILIVSGVVSLTVFRIKKGNNSSATSISNADKKSSVANSSELAVSQTKSTDTKTPSTTSVTPKTTTTSTKSTSPSTQSNVPVATPIPLGWTSVSFVKEATINLPDGFKTESFGMDFVSLTKVNISAVGITNLTKIPGTSATLKWNGWLNSYSSGSSSDSSTSALQMILTTDSSKASYDSSFFSSGYTSITSDQGLNGRKYVDSFANMERAIKYQFIKDTKLITIDYMCSKTDASKCLSEQEIDKLAKSVFFVT